MTPKVKTYQIEVWVEGVVVNTIVDTRLSLIAETFGLNEEEILWAIEEEGRCDTTDNLNRPVSITEVE